MSERRAAEMRRRFDEGFAAPYPPPAPPSEDLLLLRLGGDGYALRLGDIAGLYAGPPVMPFPEPAPGLVGIAGFRGRIAAVYDLAALLGRPAAAAPRWLALAAAAPVAFAFAELACRAPASPRTAPAPTRTARSAPSPIPPTAFGRSSTSGRLPPPSPAQKGQ
jgi:purine-binding chemotaxis protein CheW